MPWPTRLSLFVQTDVQHSGCRLLLPFLSANDLLQLSLCCRNTLSYRTYLTDFTIKYQDDVTFENKVALRSLLNSLLEPRSFVLCETRVLSLVLEWLLSPHTKESVIGVSLGFCQRPDDETVQMLEKAIQNKVFKNILHLGLYNINLGHLPCHLSRTTVPRLQSISIDSCDTIYPEALSVMLVALPGLQRLAIRRTSSSWWLDYGLLSCVTFGLRAHSNNPTIRSLEIVDIVCSRWDHDWVTEALRDGALSSLSRLVLNECFFTDAGVASIVRGVYNNCSNLVHLDLSKCGLEKEGFVALVEGVITKKLTGVSVVCSYKDAFLSFPTDVS